MDAEVETVASTCTDESCPSRLRGGGAENNGFADGETNIIEQSANRIGDDNNNTAANRRRSTLRRISLFGGGRTTEAIDPEIGRTPNYASLDPDTGLPIATPIGQNGEVMRIGEDEDEEEGSCCNKTMVITFVAIGLVGAILLVVFIIIMPPA